MKIANVEALFLQNMILVVVETDEDMYGLGEVGMRHRPQAVAGAIRDLAQSVAGQDPWRTEQLWQVMRRNGFFPLNGDVAAAAAAIDMALWDIRGKALGVPLYQLLGGLSRDYVTCYTHVGDDRDGLVARCRDAMARGYTHLRLASGLPTEPVYEPRQAMRHSIETMFLLRSELGDEVELLLDVHTRLEPPQAVTLCREIEGMRPYFVEDPLRVENPHAYATLRSRTGVPIAAGEQLTSLFEFRPFIEDELIDFARIDIANTGLTEARKIAAMAEAHHINLAVHNPLGPVTTAVSMHLNLAVPNFGVQELAREPIDHDGLFTRLQRCEGGRMYPDPTAAGLGVDIDLPRARAESRLGPMDAPRLRRADGSFTNW